MIAQIEIKTQHGQNGTVGINLLPELDHEPEVVYAHSVQDALKWLKQYPLYEDAIIDDLEDGRFIVSSKWQHRDKSFDGLLYAGLENADYTRSQALVAPVNTIYENTGYAGYKAQ